MCFFSRTKGMHMVVGYIAVYFNPARPCLLWALIIADVDNWLCVDSRFIQNKKGCDDARIVGDLAVWLASSRVNFSWSRPVVRPASWHQGAEDVFFVFVQFVRKVFGTAICSLCQEIIDQPLKEDDNNPVKWLSLLPTLSPSPILLQNTCPLIIIKNQSQRSSRRKEGRFPASCYVERGPPISTAPKFPKITSRMKHKFKLVPGSKKFKQHALAFPLCPPTSPHCFGRTNPSD